MRTLVPQTVTSAIARPIAEALEQAHGRDGELQPDDAALVPGRRCPRSRLATTAPTPMPANTPNAAATNEYAVPSKPNSRTRCRRVKPRARQRSHLGLPLLGEHHEGVDQEQHTGDHGEAADQSEEPREVVTLPIGELERLLLLVGDLDGPSPAVRICSSSTHSVARPGAVEHAAFVRHEHLSLGQHRTRRRGPGQRGEGAGRDEHVQGTVREARVETGDAEAGHDVAHGELARSGRRRTSRSGRRDRRAVRSRGRLPEPLRRLSAWDRRRASPVSAGRPPNSRPASKSSSCANASACEMRCPSFVCARDSHAGGRLGEHAVRVRATVGW